MSQKCSNNSKNSSILLVVGRKFINNLKDSLKKFKQWGPKQIEKNNKVWMKIVSIFIVKIIFSIQLITIWLTTSKIILKIKNFSYKKDMNKYSPNIQINLKIQANKTTIRAINKIILNIIRYSTVNSSKINKIMLMFNLFNLTLMKI